MCGIAGFIGKKEISEENISRTLDLMKNRGPDHRDHISFNDGNSRVVLLHSRLSIIDLDRRADQPFTIGDYTIVYNGEIYNYVELRQQLKNRGVEFKTLSDTEVLLQCYILFGENCVKYLEGMWSFAIHDRKNKKLFLSRDRFAEKPLYYTETKDGVYFGSEVKFIKSLSGNRPTVNTQHILRYLVNGYKSLYASGETFFTDIKEVSYATNLLIEQDLIPKITRYWQPVYEPADMTMNEAVEGFRHHFIESVKIRLRADVPLAFCLSGGVDSSAIVSVAKKVFNYDVKTFSIIDSDERYNEYDNIKTTIDDLSCKNTVIDIPKNNFFSRLEQLVEYHDAPVAVISYYIHSFLSELIAQNGYKVVVSGTGADELVSGYYDHFNLHLYEMRNETDYTQYLNDWDTKVKHFIRNPFLKNPRLYFENTQARSHVYLDNDIFAGVLTKDFNECFKEKRYSDSLLRNRMLNELFHEAIPVILHEDDLNSMFYSIENRSPFLDSRLFKFAYSIPNKYLIRDGYGKYILRAAMKGILNEKVRTDRRKKGFNASVTSLLDFNCEENKMRILDDSNIYKLVKKEEIEKLMQVSPLPESLNKFLFYFLSAKIFLELNG